MLLTNLLLLIDDKVKVYLKRLINHMARSTVFPPKVQSREQKKAIIKQVQSYNW